MKKPQYKPEFCEDEHGAYVRAPMPHGQFLVVDASDWPWVSQTHWSIHRNGATWYAERQATKAEPNAGRKVKLHRVVVGLPDDDPRRADHADGNGLNNRRYNLRPATQAQNTWNRRARRKDFGIWETTCGKWVAAIRHNNQRIYLGSFATKDEARAGYASAETRYRGEFAAAPLSEGARMGQHAPAECSCGAGTYHRAKSAVRGGSYSHIWHCPICDRKGAFLDNRVGDGQVLCIGYKFVLPRRQHLPLPPNPETHNEAR